MQILFCSTLFFSILFYCCNVVFLRYWCGLTIAYFGSLHPLTCRTIISPERLFNSVIHHHAWEFHRALMHWLCTLTEPQLKEMNQGFPECSVKPLELAGRLSWLQRTSVCISASSAFMGMHVFFWCNLICHLIAMHICHVCKNQWNVSHHIAEVITFSQQIASLSL